MYDRFAHLIFGLFFAFPFREMFLRITGARGFWSYYYPVEMTFMVSVIYELIEFGAAVTSDPAAGLSFLGTQGDIWDAQKDMLCSGIGAIIGMLGVFIVQSGFSRYLKIRCDQ